MDGAGDLRERLTSDEFGLFRDWIHEHAGLFVDAGDNDPLSVSVLTRSKLLGISDVAEYFRLLSADEAEFKELMNLVTINETSFFRFPAQFDALRERVVPELLATVQPGSGLRVWSAGCSTGEEPFSIAMTLLDSAAATAGPMRVVGTDVSTQALEKARAARYPRRAVATVPAPTVSRWFEHTDTEVRPRAEVRELCEFGYHNLARQPYPAEYASGWDVIFCRNVTIYFQRALTQRVIQRFFDALRPGGYLFIGHSETLTAITDQFETREMGGVFLYRKPLESFAVPVTPPMSAPARRSSRTRVAHGSAAGTATPEAALAAAGSARGSGTADSAQRSPRRRPARSTPSDERLVRAHALLEDARPAEALALARQVLAAGAGDDEARLVIAYAHADLGDFDAAADGVLAVLAANPLSAPARYLLGTLRKEQGDTEGAFGELRRTLYADPDFALAHFALANLHRQRGESAEAAREYASTMRVLESAPDGGWTAFLGGFTPEVLHATCKRGLAECVRRAPAPKDASRTGR